MIARPDLDAIAREIVGTRFAGRGEVHDRVLSTNDSLQELARSGAPEGTFVIAGEQAAGRGRRERRWVSEAGAGLYLSVLFRPRTGSPIYWTLGAAVAACDTCREFGAPRTTIKWPNDLLVDGRKIAGILVETRTGGATIRDLVVGIGVNVHHDERQLEALGVPGVTSLHVEHPDGKQGGRSAVAASFLRRMEDVARRIETDDWSSIADAWLERSPNATDTEVTVLPADRAPWSGVSAGLAADGALRVRDDDEQVHRVHQVDSVRFKGGA